MTPDQFEALAQQIRDGQPPVEDQDWKDHHGLTWPLDPHEVGWELDPQEDEGQDLSSPTKGPQPSDADLDGAHALTEAYPYLGIDVLAFYKTFRRKASRPFPGRWGIFLLRTGLRSMTDQLMAVRPELPHHELEDLARRLLIAHEAYHFFVDVRALAMEGEGIEKPYPHCYLPYRHAVGQAADPDRNFEESLANHFAHKSFRRRDLSDGTSPSQMIAKVLRAGPIPYCDFELKDEERARVEGLLGLSLRSGTDCLDASYRLHTQGVEPDFFSVAMTPTIKRHPVAPWSACPIQTVRAFGISRLLSPFQGPSHNEMESFVSQYLKGSLERQSDHRYFRIDNGELVKFPNEHEHNVMGRELKNILFKAGMTMGKFNQERIRTRTWRRGCPRAPILPPIKDQG